MGVKAELYFNYLKEEGFLPRVDDDGDVVFKREGGTYFLKADEEDKQYFQLVFPAFWKLEDPGEDKKAREVINELNANLKVMKMFIVRDDVWASVEMFVEPLESFRPVFGRALRLLANGASKFYAKMRPEDFA